MSAERSKARPALKRLLGMVLSGIMVIGGTVLVTPAPAYAWGAWAEVPGAILTVDTPAVVGDTAEVFVRGTDNKIYRNRRTGANSWAGWCEVPGNGYTLSAPAAVLVPGGLFLFVRGTDNRVYFTQRTGIGCTPSNYVKWTPWQPILKNFSGAYSGLTYSAPSAVFESAGGQNRIHLFIRGLDDRVYQRHHVGGGWQGEWDPSPSDGATPDAPAAALMADGRTIALTVRGTDNRIYRNMSDPGGFTWQGWGELDGDGTTYQAPGVAYDSIGNFRTFVNGTDAYIYRHYGYYWYQEPAGRQSFSAPAAAFTQFGLCVFIHSPKSGVVIPRGGVFFSCQ
ncbi:hypothetical protein ACIBSW_18625 [Actinoplanes sp. NPDC049668]|uniref:hypothetical protein n=1 Tax=unclassified Actinoplanes TaxID=2626549 RepID=UPI0033B1E1EB